jgi:hypothetical protein
MSKKKQTRRRFTPEFKAETVNLVKQGNRTMADIAMADQRQLVLPVVLPQLPMLPHAP